MIFESGSRIGAYKIVRLLGQSGMGDVYEVEHVELGTHYALKAFSCDYEEADLLRKKFLDEGRSLARLEHPNIVRVFDLAVEPQSQMPYFVMDLVLYDDGEAHTIEDVDKADIDENLVYFWFKDAAAALDYIHSLGIVHCDIKPNNMLLGKDLHLKLTDFGISRIFGEKLKRDIHATPTLVTKTGLGKTVLGTEHYMSPEVALGENPTPAADAYALGMMCFRLLTGLWYEPGTDAISLLAKFKLRWMAVLPQLLSIHPEKRPKELYRLKERLKGTPVSAPQSKLEPKKSAAKRRRNVLAVVIGMAIAVAICGGLYNGGKYAYEEFQKWQAEQNRIRRAQYEEQLRAKEAQARKLQELEAKLKERTSQAKVKETVLTQVVTRVAQDDGRDMVSELDALYASEPRPEKKPQSKPQEKMEIVGRIDDKVDYGPIPQVAYQWFADKGNDSPRSIAFKLANGATIDLVPFRKGSFFVPNMPQNGKAYHQVMLTRPFWMSKLEITVEQLRDLYPNDYEGCREVEREAKGRYPLYKNESCSRLFAFCDYLSKRYRSQLPAGYVFRLPTDAEYARALDVRMTKRDAGGKYWDRYAWCGRNACEAFANLMSSCRSVDWSKWKDGAWWKDWCFGGLADPLPTGVCDLIHWEQFVLDRVSGNALPIIDYADEETDSLLWTESDAFKVVYESCDGKKCLCNANDKKRAHLVLGPDLISEGNWRERKTVTERVVKAPVRKYLWKTPNKLSHPLEMKFKLMNGEDMVFCYCPKGKFNMSNGHNSRETHRVELTRPFWMTKYCVTVKQWREFGKYDCEGDCRTLEKHFVKHPICLPFNRYKWVAYCDFLNERYGAMLPKGYVFRLPTEAEWEWAFVADENRTVWDVDGNATDIWSENLKRAFEDLKKKYRVPKNIGCDVMGLLGSALVGGRTFPNGFGLCELGVPNGRDVITLDAIEFRGGDASRALAYRDREIDPVRWDGAAATCSLVRFRDSHHLKGFEEECYAHVVIGPDVLAPLKAAEKAPYPQEDFGGRRISDVCKIGGFSSLSAQYDSPKRHALLLDPRRAGLGDGYAFHSDCELRPWVHIDLPQKMQVVGLCIENRRSECIGRAVPLVIWISDDGKRWVEVARETQVLSRYRIDLTRKNVTGKCLRIGRAGEGPGARKECFHLNRIIIYGK